MEIDLAVVAEHALTDNANKMSVIGMFDIIGAPQFPTVHPRLFLCLRIACRAIEVGSRHTFAVRLQDQDGKQLAAVPGEFVVGPSPYPNAPTSFANIIIAFNGLTLERVGTHSFEIAIDQQHRRSVALTVVQGPAPRV